MAEGPVTFLLNKLSSLLENEVRLFSNIQHDVIHVRDELARIKGLLRTADSLAERDDEVRVWVDRIRDHAYSVEDILDEFTLVSAHEHEYGAGGLLSKVSENIKIMKARYRVVLEFRRVSSRIKSVCEANERLHQKLKRVGQVSRSFDAEHPPENFQEAADLVGIEEPKRQLVRWLVEGPPQREVVAVVGLGGVGKTALAKQAFDDPSAKKHFAVRVWVRMSPSSQIEELLKDMLQQVARQIRKPTPRKAGYMGNSDWLKMMIKSMLLDKRYLIFLDDVWRVSKWDAVKYAFPNDKHGSRVMITTRSADVASALLGDIGGKMHELMPLPEESSWKLFCRRTFGGDACPPNLEVTSRAILKKCEGLPLPIVVIGGLLASKDSRRIDEWDFVRRSLRMEINNDNDGLTNIFKVVSLGFNDLPYYLKSCFLLLSVFPEDQELERMRIIRLWVAEGFVEVKQGRTLEEVADDYLNELLNRGLLQAATKSSDGRVKLCCIQQILQHIAIGKSREQKFAAIADEQTTEWPENVRRISIHGKSFRALDRSRSFSRLRSLFAFGMDKSMAKAAVLSAPKLLRVLDLRAAPLQKFPLQVVDMCCLRYLSFRCSEVRSVPSSIGNLQNLETLDLKHTYINELPLEISKLRRLRHLLVYRYETISYSHCRYGFRTYADIGCLQSLQKLCYVDAAHERSRSIVRDIGKLTQLRRLCILRLKREDGVALCSSISMLTNLCSLAIYSLEDDEVLDLQELVLPPPSLQRIYLRGRLLALPDWIPALDGLVKMHLRRCRLKDDPFLALQGLPNLAHLELQEVYDWNILCFDASGFTKLKRLVLDDFQALRQIQVEKDALPCLVGWTVQRCKLLQELPSGIEHLTKLKVLEFFDVHEELVRKLKMGDRSEDYRRVAHIPEVHYGLWTDGGWDVRLVERSGTEAGSSSCTTDSEEQK